MLTVTSTFIAAVQAIVDHHQHGGAGFTVDSVTNTPGLRADVIAKVEGIAPYPTMPQDIASALAAFAMGDDNAEGYWIDLDEIAGGAIVIEYGNDGTPLCVVAMV